MLSYITRINFRSRKKSKSILLIYKKVVYICQNVMKNSAGIVKKMSFCDKMTKKSVGGTLGLSICNKLFKYDQGTSTFLDQVLVISPP